MFFKSAENTAHLNISTHYTWSHLTELTVVICCCIAKVNPVILETLDIYEELKERNVPRNHTKNNHTTNLNACSSNA